MGIISFISSFGHPLTTSECRWVLWTQEKMICPLVLVVQDTIHQASLAAKQAKLKETMRHSWFKSNGLRKERNVLTSFSFPLQSHSVHSVVSQKVS